MKQIIVAEQPVLGFARTVRVTIDGIRYRLFRSLVTVAVVAVAVAFLMNIASESVTKRAVARETRARIERLRLGETWASRLTAPAGVEELLRDLAAGAPGAIAESTRMGGLGPQESLSAREAARSALTYLSFFERLDYDKRRLLTYTATGAGIFDRLTDGSSYAAFAAQLRNMPSVRFPGRLEEFESFVRAWPSNRVVLERIQAGRLKAVAVVHEAMGGRQVLEALTQADGAFGDAVRRAGFEFDASETAPVVARQARRIICVGVLEDSIRTPAMRMALAQWLDVLPGDVTVTAMWKSIVGPAAAERYLAKMRDEGMETMGLTADEVAQIAASRHEADLLEKAARLTADVGGGWLGLGSRTAWLLMLSILVCGIGISNAMLMSVTERFREIATMKCLGALDGFIMLMFVIESCVLGVVGGLAGAVLGGVIGTGRMLVLFGTTFAGSLPAGEIVASMSLAVGVGLVLAGVAAVYPAYRAARLAPMEAMRIE